MIEPTLAEVRYFQIHGRLPESLKKRRQQAQQSQPEAPKKERPKSEIIAPQSQPEQEIEIVQPNNPQWPQHKGGPWWMLSTGKKVNGKDNAMAAQAKIDGG